MERTLEALEKIGAGEDILLQLYCQPHPLFDILRRNGYRWTETVQDDGTHEIRIRKA